MFKKYQNNNVPVADETLQPPVVQVISMTINLI